MASFLVAIGMVIWVVSEARLLVSGIKLLAVAFISFSIAFPTNYAAGGIGALALAMPVLAAGPLVGLGKEELHFFVSIGGMLGGTAGLAASGTVLYRLFRRRISNIKPNSKWAKLAEE